MIAGEYKLLRLLVELARTAGHWELAVPFSRIGHILYIGKSKKTQSVYCKCPCSTTAYSTYAYKQSLQPSLTAVRGMFMQFNLLIRYRHVYLVNFVMVSTFYNLNFVMVSTFFLNSVK